MDLFSAIIAGDIKYITEEINKSSISTVIDPWRIIDSKEISQKINLVCPGLSVKLKR
jgi:hypothetical protein